MQDGAPVAVTPKFTWDKMHASEGVLSQQTGSNLYASQKLMSVGGIGAPRANVYLGTDKGKDRVLVACCTSNYVCFWENFRQLET